MSIDYQSNTNELKVPGAWYFVHVYKTLPLGLNTLSQCSHLLWCISCLSFESWWPFDLDILHCHWTWGQGHNYKFIL